MASQVTKSDSCVANLLSTCFLEKAPELWAYQATVIRAARNYDNSAWVAYDHQFRREALAAKDLNWSVPNHRLYRYVGPGVLVHISPRIFQDLVSHMYGVVICKTSTHHLSHLYTVNPNPFAAL